MMETRYLEDAIGLLNRAEAKLSRYSKTTDDYNFRRQLEITAREAEKELYAIQRGEHVKTVYVGEPEEPIITECYCRGDSGPCKWCETHCHECEEDLDECSCEATQ